MFDLLARQSVASEKALEGWLWFGGLVLALLACMVVLLYVRRRIRHRGGDDQAPLFDLDELRKMRDTGELTIPEYEVLRRRTLARMGLSTADHDEGKVAGAARGRR